MLKKSDLNNKNGLIVPTKYINKSDLSNVPGKMLNNCPISEDRPIHGIIIIQKIFCLLITFFQYTKLIVT